MSEPLAGFVSVPADAQTSAQERARELFVTQYPRLAGWSARLTGDVEAGKEIASEVFTRLWNRWSGVDEPIGFLYVTAANLVRDRWRAAGRERRAFRLFGSGQPMASGDPDNSVLDEVNRLPTRLREVVLLHYYADLSIVQVADVLRANVGTVKRRLHEARQRLSEALGERDE